MNNDSSFLTVAVGGMTLPDHPQGRDWPTIPLGDPAGWPEGPRALADLITGSRFPMLMALGPELRLFYNGAYAELLGDKHPAAQGAPFPQVRPELWPRLESAFRSAQAGDSTQLDNALMEFERNGKRERRYFCSSFAPVRHGGEVVGVYCVLSDTTSDVLSGHRHAFHLKLSDTLGSLVDAVHIMQAASAMTGRQAASSKVA